MHNAILHEWLHPVYLQEDKITKLQHSFSSAKSFPHLVLAHFLVEKKATAILRAIAKEKLVLKDSDLFTFFQTNDFKITRSKVLLDFRNFLCSNDFSQYLTRITACKIKSKRIDMSASLYLKTHYLLPHDDRLERRRIAYLYYLSTLAKKDGGALALYDSKNKKPTEIVKKIVPQFNTFAFFEVSGCSFHEVEEIVSDKQRIAISGWFHDQ